MPLKKQKSIGVWGYGLVGKAAASFLQKKGAQVIVYDDKPIQSPPKSIQVAHSLEQFFEQATQILPSPGVDIRPYKNVYQGEWLCELDLFQAYFCKPIIAITGSVGKTTITHLLTQVLKQSGWRVEAAGNIGVPCFQMIEKQNELDAVVLELSSFQLEHTKSFVPDLAIWTNFHPNHLDRHTTMQDYFLAKYNMMKYQSAKQHALFPVSLRNDILTHNPQSSISFFSEHDNQNTHFYIENDSIISCINNRKTKLIDLNTLDQTVFPINWLTIYSALQILKVQAKQIQTVSPIEHRLEKVAMINNICFYNDSKSTTPASTLAAIQRMQAPRTVLFLGGLSKGIDRTALIQNLQKKPIYVICFGTEAQMLKKRCDTVSLASIAFATLEQAFQFCTTIMQPNDCVLFSPSGSSFDLFQNYKERGDRFKQLVQQYLDTL